MKVGLCMRLSHISPVTIRIDDVVMMYVSVTTQLGAILRKRIFCCRGMAALPPPPLAERY